jgi:hypothetical protein
MLGNSSALTWLRGDDAVQGPLVGVGIRICTPYSFISRPIPLEANTHLSTTSLIKPHYKDSTEHENGKALPRP